MWLLALGALLLVLFAFLGWGYANTIRDPVMRTASFGYSDWPASARPIRVALITDPHLQGPDMPPERIARIAAQVALQKPDLILLAGDFVGDRALGTVSIATPRSPRPCHFRAPLGTWAVLGNHDHWRDGPSMRRALEAVGIPVLDNRGPRRPDHAGGSRRSAYRECRRPRFVACRRAIARPDFALRAQPRCRAASAAALRTGSRRTHPLRADRAAAGRPGRQFLQLWRALSLRRHPRAGTDHIGRGWAWRQRAPAALRRGARLVDGHTRPCSRAVATNRRAVSPCPS